MKMTKKAFQLFVLAFALLFAGALNAQSETTKPNPERRQPMSADEMAKKRTDHQKETLGLSDEQYQKVYEINKKGAEKSMALRKEAREDREARMKEAQAMEAEQMAQMNKVLTPEQYEKYKMGKEKNKEKMKERRGPRPEGGGRGKGPGNKED